MSDTCPVVRIVSADHAQYGGFKEINESDFNPETDTIWVNFADMSVDDMRALLEASGVKFRPNASEDALRELCQGIK